MDKAGADSWIDFTSWTQDGVLRQASLQEVRERTDKTLRPDWINLLGTRAASAHICLTGKEKRGGSREAFSSMLRDMRVPAIALLLLLATSTASAETIAGRASVIDADTLQINGERIRVLDIDAPEKDQFCQQAVGDVTWECGIEATFALIDWIGESDVVCETDRLDRYKRHLARCTVEGEDLAVWLAESGWGVPFRDCKCEAVREASARAQAEGRGIWIGPFVLPWEWRRAR